MRRAKLNHGGFRLPILFGGAVIATTLFATTASFTASNTVPTNKAGEGSNTISGYTASAIHYVLNSDPTKIDQITFNLNSTPVSGSNIKVQLLSGGDWYSCTNVAAAITCDTTTPSQATVSPANSLTVIVTD